MLIENISYICYLYMFYYTGLVNSKTLINVKTRIKESLRFDNSICVCHLLFIRLFSELAKFSANSHSTRESDLNIQASLQKVKN